jgi:hypothetical protein
MDTRQWDRLAAATGIVFVLMQIATGVLMGDTPDFDAGPREIREYFIDDGGAILAVTMINALSALFFIWFLGSLRAVLRVSEGGQGRLSAVAFAGGLATITIAVAASLPGAALAWEDTARVVDLGTLAFVWNLNALGFVGLVGTGMAFVLAVSVVIFRTRLFPSWVGVVGVLAAIAQLLNAFTLVADDYETPFAFFGFLGFALTMIFILIMSIYMVIRLGANRAGPATV